MKLDEGQRQKLAEWIEQGLELSEIQDRLAQEFGLRMTYMELRLLLSELDLKPKDKDHEGPPAEVKPDAAPAPGADAPGEETTPAERLGGVSVSIDQVTRPGALVSGKVTFPSGKSADWYLDQMGRLGLMPHEQGWRPSAGEVEQFQRELQNELSKMGY